MIMLNLLSGEGRIYLNYDTAYTKNLDSDAFDDVYTIETLNTITSSEFPNHKLRLKVNSSVILLLNIDQSLGLCNKT